MTTLSQSAISIPKLRAELAGDVIGPEDAEYEHARRVFLSLVDRRPAVIVRPPDADGVARVVSLARENGVELAVRSGGHSSAGHGVCEDGIVLDLSRMKALEIDPARRIAQSRIMVNVAAIFATPEEAPIHESWATDFAATLRQADTGAYVNFLADEGEERVRAAYPGRTWDRLVAVKRQYDPTNLFRLNQNIPPQQSAAESGG